MLQVRFGPAHVLAAGSVAAAAVVVLDIWLACSMPWLGLEFRAPASGPGVEISRVFERGPAAGTLRRGELIAGVEAADGTALPIGAEILALTPYDQPTYAAFNHLFEIHRPLWAAIDRDAVALLRSDGSRAWVHPQRPRPPTSLPLDFWAMALLAAMAILVGSGVWAFRPREAASSMLFVACVGLALVAAMMAVFKGRELTLPPGRVPLLWATEQFGEYFVAPLGLVSLLWVYPQRFKSPGWLGVIAGLLLLGWAATQWQWWPSPAWPPGFSTLSFLALVPLAAWQWRASEARPADRAALRTLLLAMLVPFGTVVVASSVPMLLGQRPLVASGLALAGLIAVFFVGMALGVSRYRLFHLDRWWFEALMWALGGAAVLLFDAALLWLHASAQIALGAAVALAGWLYFPLRQWLWQRVSPAARQTVERHLPQLIDTLFSADSSAALQANWRRLLEQVYAPLAILPLAAPRQRVAIADDGQVLELPGLGSAAPLALHHADKGRRLFASGDAALARALLALTQQAAQARRAQDERAAEQQARQRERELLVQDLHDGLGGTATNIGLLATLARRESDLGAMRARLATIGELAEAALAEIRGFMDGLEDRDADWLSIAGDWRADVRRLVEPHGLTFEMIRSIAEAAPPPDSVVRLSLERIYKEALMNVVKHARARRVTVRLAVQAHELRLEVEDDGAGMPRHLAEGPVKSRGLSIMRRRAERLGGRLSIGRPDDPAATGTAIRLRVPLPAKYPAKAPDPGDADTRTAH